MDRWKFYKKKIVEHLNKESKILIISASPKEIAIFNKNNFKNYYVSYFDHDQKKEILTNSAIDEKNLIQLDITKNNFHLKNEEFDYVVIHAVIHHLDKPHLGILNLYDFVSRGLIIIESNDSILMKICTKLKFVEEFEYSAISNNKGGLLNSGVPNYIYRWTEREIKKLIYSYKPNFQHDFIFDYNFDFDNQKLYEIGSLFKKILYKFSFIIVSIFNFILKNQGNNFFIFIKKKN